MLRCMQLVVSRCDHFDSTRTRELLSTYRAKAQQRLVVVKYSTAYQTTESISVVVWQNLLVSVAISVLLSLSPSIVSLSHASMGSNKDNNVNESAHSVALQYNINNKNNTDYTNRK